MNKAVRQMWQQAGGAGVRNAPACSRRHKRRPQSAIGAGPCDMGSGVTLQVAAAFTLPPRAVIDRIRKAGLHGGRRNVTATQARNAQQKTSRSVSTKALPLGFHPTLHAWKLGSGTCTQLAPSGDHRYTRVEPLQMARRSCVGSHPNAATSSTCISAAASSSLWQSHTHTVAGMLSHRVARYLPEEDHFMTPTPSLGLALSIGGFSYLQLAGSAETT
mmetsp:Transcript_26881/g.69700  ORF Transcript_26881/g.69700 Transcript_26881/m.69700 type:complete len:217 (+) Transcript_26881:244-894(+)